MQTELESTYAQVIAGLMAMIGRDQLVISPEYLPFDHFSIHVTEDDKGVTVYLVRD